MSASAPDEERCAACGRTPADHDAPSWAWSRSTGRDGRPQALCPECARRHARSIEAKLDDEWW